jgi:hypothetical protein
VTSLAATWSSSKIAQYINGINGIFYISLSETANEGYTTEVELSEIEQAYQNGKFIWIIANDLHLPLRVRVSATEWIFSGYTNSKACDIKIDTTGVNVTYTDIITKNVIDGIETQYNAETDTVTFI